MSTHPSRRRGTAAGALLSLIAAPLAVVASTSPASAAPQDEIDVQILATNDFHGRLENNSSGTEAGAAVLAGAVKELRGENPNTVFAAAGDLVGASTFTSFIQNDKPTIDALNEAGLDVSAVGNHEFDQGYDDLVDRIMAPESAQNPDGGAEWQYIGANVRLRATGDPAVPASWTQDFGDVRVGFVGAVTEELPSLVSPDGISDIRVDPIVSSVNTEADKLVTDGGADLVILLVHEGASTPALASATDPDTAFGKIVNGVDANIDAIVSGHTHLLYNHSVPVPEWAAEGRAVTERPVVSSGQYGSNLNQLIFTVDAATGEVVAKEQNVLALKDAQVANYPADPDTAAIVTDAVAAAEGPGSVVVGEIEDPFSRAKFANGTTENRGGESTLGNLVAEIQRWATREPESGAAQIAFMNPGGLRADLVGSLADGTRDVTYRQAANVQPFANTLVNMDLTGAQIETVLEQQWQLTSTGTVPSRPFLKLGVSDGFEYTYTTSERSTPSADDGEATYTQGEITRMTLDGEPVVPSEVYSVTVNSFLASGGDNFRELANGTDRADTGKADLQAQVDYFEQVVGDEPLAPDYSQRAVGVDFAGDSKFEAGDTVAFDLSSLIMTGSVGTAPDVVTDAKDSEVSVSLGGKELGTFPVDSTIVEVDPTTPGAADAASSDEAGTASVQVRIPAGTKAGRRELVVTGATTGTEIVVPVRVTGGAKVTPRMTVAAPAKVKPGARPTVKVNLSAKGPGQVRGVVKVASNGKAVAKPLTNGTVKVRLAKLRSTTKVTVRYLGNKRFDKVTKKTTIKVARTK